MGTVVLSDIKTYKSLEIKTVSNYQYRDKEENHTGTMKNHIVGKFDIQKRLHYKLVRKRWIILNKCCLDKSLSIWKK